MERLYQLPCALKHRVEYAVVRSVFAVLGFLPFAWVSNIGAAAGWFFATLPVRSNITARRNIRLVYPRKSEKDVRRMQQAAAVNMGRTFFELPAVYSLPAAAVERLITVKGLQHLKRNEGALVLTGHLGNWEVLLRACSLWGIPVASVYRAANNPHVNGFLVGLRSKTGQEQIPKGAHGARALLKAVRDGKSVGFLNDQKLNEGALLPFLGEVAPTPTALAELALRYGRPIVPAFCVRSANNPAAFEIIIHPPIDGGDFKEQENPVEALTIRCNEILGGAIGEYADQWLWFHRRFG